MIEKLKELLKNSGNKILTVEFVKKDGTLRKLNGRFGVTKQLKGGERKNSNPNHVIIFDIVKKGYRTINLETIKSLNTNGQKYIVDNNKVFLEV